jgi:hypothetical protein
MATDTGMGYRCQVVHAGSSVPTLAFFELTPTLDAAIVAGTVPSDVTRAVVRDNAGSTREVKLIPFAAVLFFATPVGTDVDDVTVTAIGPGGKVAETRRTSVRRAAREHLPFR